MPNAKCPIRSAKLPFKREFSAGCIVFKRPTTNDQRPTTKFLIGKHSGYHQWVLPKGLIEEGEHGWQTCLRETEEEMGVKAKLIQKKPVHTVKYFFVANYKPQRGATLNRTCSGSGQKSQPPPSRRISQYQESGGQKTKVFKVVNFYLAEYLSGDPQNHGWEMEDAGWYSFQDALKKLAFPGEKQTLQKAKKILSP